MQNNNLYICKICYKKKNMNDLYKCITCEKNLCQICKLKHNKSHKIINYINKDCICKMHNSFFIKYCNQCKENLCKSCEGHDNHNKDDLEEMIPNKKTINIQIIKLRKNIDKLIDFVNDVKEKVKKLNILINNIEKYYKLSSNYIYRNEIKNYQTLQNIKEFENFNNIVINDLNKIFDDENNISNILNFMIDINSQINNKVNEDLYSKYMNKINYKFKKNPNFKYNSDIIRNNDCLGKNDIFEVYNLYKDNNQYIASPNYLTKYIDIYSLIDNKKVLSLKGHIKNITTIRYFFNIKSYNEYLISADTNKIVIIWDITNNYKIKFKINTNYIGNIYSCLLVFPHNNEDIIITSTEHSHGTKMQSSTKAYSLNIGNFIKYIDDYSHWRRIFYLLSWYNKNDNNYYIIQFSIYEIFITNLFIDQLYSAIENYALNDYNGLIFNRDNKDFLFFNSSSELKIYDLYNKSIIKKIKLNLFKDIININPWNDNYLILIAKESFLIIDLINNKIISSIEFRKLDTIKSIKRINHPLYGESILSCGNDIKLWTI